MGNSQYKCVKRKKTNTYDSIKRRHVCLNTHQLITSECGVQCKLLVPPSSTKTSLVKEKKFSTKEVQVEIRNCVRNRSTLTEYSSQLLNRGDICNQNFNRSQDGKSIYRLLNETKFNHSVENCKDKHSKKLLKNHNTLPEIPNQGSCVFSTHPPLHSVWEQNQPASNRYPEYDRNSSLGYTVSPDFQLNAAGDSLPSPPPVDFFNWTVPGQNVGTQHDGRCGTNQKLTVHNFSKHEHGNNTMGTQTNLPSSTFENQLYEFPQVVQSTVRCKSPINCNGTYATKSSIPNIHMCNAPYIRQAQISPDYFSQITQNTRFNNPYWLLPTLPESGLLETVCTNQSHKENHLQDKNTCDNIFSNQLNPIRKSSSWHNLTDTCDYKSVPACNFSKSSEALWDQTSTNKCPYINTDRERHLRDHSTCIIPSGKLYYGHKYRHPLEGYCQGQINTQFGHRDLQQYSPNIFSVDFMNSNTNQSASCPQTENQIRSNRMRTCNRNRNIHCSQNFEHEFKNPSRVPQFYSVETLNYTNPSQSERFKDEDYTKFRKQQLPVNKFQSLTGFGSQLFDNCQHSRQDCKLLRNSKHRAWPEQLRTPTSQSMSSLLIPTNRQRFFLKETARLDKIIADPTDRRIRAICDRFQCDLEVYSKIPKSGFLQYAIDITAPEQAALHACVRSLDSALGWCLSPQLCLGKRFQI